MNEPYSVAVEAQLSCPLDDTKKAMVIHLLTTAITEKLGPAQHVRCNVVGGYCPPEAQNHVAQAIVYTDRKFSESEELQFNRVVLMGLMECVFKATDKKGNVPLPMVAIFSNIQKLRLAGV